MHKIHTHKISLADALGTLPDRTSSSVDPAGYLQDTMSLHELSSVSHVTTRVHRHTRLLSDSLGLFVDSPIGTADRLHTV